MNVGLVVIVRRHHHRCLLHQIDAIDAIDALFGSSFFGGRIRAHHVTAIIVVELVSFRTMSHNTQHIFCTEYKQNHGSTTMKLTKLNYG